MILNVSGRTDIVGFYMKWFIKRYQEGFIDVRNPFYPKQVSRIFFEDVDAILFCTKNPVPLLQYTNVLKKPFLVHVTITPYQKEIEPYVPSKRKTIDAIKKLASKIGKENIVIRYDPIFLSAHYSIQYHIKAFQKLCHLLNGATNRIIISFLDNYKNVEKNQTILQTFPFEKEDLKRLGLSFSQIARENGMTIQTCFEKEDLVEYGFIKGECLSKTLAFQLTGKVHYKKWKARGCNCVEMVDIGVYNTCPHRCKYCYANYREEEIVKNIVKHDENSSLLIGHLEQDDVIKRRK